MYRNYDLGYGGAPPPGRRVPVPDFPFCEPHFRVDYVNPYMSDPYLGMPDSFYSMRGSMGMRGPYPRPRQRPGRGGISDWGAQLVNRQIEKSTDKIMSQYCGMGKTECDADAPGVSSSSKKETDYTTKSETESNNPQISSQDKATSTTPKPAIPIGPRISAKQMWESSYREKVSEKEETASLMPPPLPKQIKPPEPTTNASKKRKQNDKFKRGPHFKRKKKTDDNTEADNSINGNTIGATSDGETYPRMCKVCNVKITSEEQSKIHNENEIHKQNVNKFLTGDNEKAMKMTLAKLNETVALPTNTPDCLAWEPDMGDRTLNSVRFCRLCSVRMTSLQNAKQHYDGKSHAKRIRIVQHGHCPARKPFRPTHFVSGGLLGSRKAPITGAYSYSSAFIQAQPHINQPMSTMNLKPALPGNFANSMTPSGQYYCQTCDIVIQHAGSLNSHLQSKAHKIAKAKS